MITAVDASIIIDIREPDPDHGPSPPEALRRCLREGSVIACDVVWAEMATAFGHAQARAVKALREIGIAYSAMSEAAARSAGTGSENAPRGRTASSPTSWWAATPSSRRTGC